MAFAARTMAQLRHCPFILVKYCYFENNGLSLYQQKNKYVSMSVDYYNSNDFVELHSPITMQDLINKYSLVCSINDEGGIINNDYGDYTESGYDEIYFVEMFEYRPETNDVDYFYGDTTSATRTRDEILENFMIDETDGLSINEAVSLINKRIREHNNTEFPVLAYRY